MAKYSWHEDYTGDVPQAGWSEIVQPKHTVSSLLLIVFVSIIIGLFSAALLSWGPYR